MHYATRDKFLTAAFAVVKETDPEIYARISADNALWTTSPNALVAQGIRHGIDPEYMVAGTLDAMDTAFGWTLSDADQDPIMRPTSPLVFINEDKCRELAPEKHLDPVNLAASVIVHEFYHVHQVDNDEQPAYAQQIAFARKMASPDGARIAREESHTAKHVLIAQGR